MQNADTATLSFIELTADIVSAYVAKNPVPVSELPALIDSVHQSIIGLGSPRTAPEANQPLKPAVNPKKSVFDDHIVCLDDGKKFKSMRRHLSMLGMTPDEYRAKWGLPSDYPMVAPAYAKARSELARSMGLGRKVDAEVKGKGRTRAA